MTDDNDMALVALLNAVEADPAISTELLRKSYVIERRHQFDRDDTRELSMLELKSLLEAIIDQEISA